MHCDDFVQRVLGGRQSIERFDILAGLVGLLAGGFGDKGAVFRQGFEDGELLRPGFAEDILHQCRLTHAVAVFGQPVGDFLVGGGAVHSAELLGGEAEIGQRFPGALGFLVGAGERFRQARYAGFDQIHALIDDFGDTGNRR